MKRIKIELTDREAFLIDKALSNETITEDIGQGEYPISWLCVYRSVNRKLRKAGADVEEE